MKTSSKKNVNKNFKNQTNLKKVDSTSKRSQLEIQTAQPASTFVSGRELKTNSLADAESQNQLPVRAKNGASGRVQNKNEKKVIKYDYKSKNKAAQNSRINTREVSSVGKKISPRYKSLEQQNSFQKRYETSESPNKRRGGPLAIGRSGNFNIKKWAYASKKDISKIIIIERWWRYMLKKLNKNNRRILKNVNKTEKYRAKSTKSPKTMDLTTFMKQAENITEKIYPGKNNKLIVETRKVEVFKINRPKQQKPLKAESKVSKKYKESIKTKQQYSELEQSGNITDKIITTIDSDGRKGEVKKISQQTAKSGMKIGSKEKERYGGSSKDSKQYGQMQKKGENITEKIYPGKDNTLINEKRKVEVFKLDKSKSKDEVRVDSRGKGRFSEEVEMPNLRKKGEQITEKIFPGKENTLISEKRKVEIYKLKKDRTKEDIDKSTKEGRRHAGSLDKSKEYTEIEKQGENITEKIFPGRDNKLIVETRKVEVYKRSTSKDRFPVDERESKRHTRDMKEYEKYGETIKEQGRYIPDYKKSKQFLEIEREKGLIKEPRKRGQQIKKVIKFVEKDGITKKFIRQKMAEIWHDENVATSPTGITLYGYGQSKTNKTLIYGNRGFSSEKKAVGTDTSEIDRLNNIISAIKAKDVELNKVVSQLKTQLAGKSRTYDTHIGGTISVTGAKKGEKIDNSSYEEKIKQLLTILREKDNKVNQLVNQIKNQSTSTNIYEYENRPFDENDQRITHTRITTRGKDKSKNKNTLTIHDSINRTIDEFDTINTQNTIGSERDNGRNFTNIRTTTNSTEKNILETGTEAGRDYQSTITHLETIIKEKDEELEKIANQLNAQANKKPEFIDLDIDRYGLGILSEKETWNEVVMECPINNLYICDRRDWNEINEISQLDLSIMSLGKKWEDVVEEGRDALNFTTEEKNPFEHQKIEFLQINGQSIFDKWLDEIQPNNEIDSLEFQKKRKN
jgi:hypothetical protein